MGGYLDGFFLLNLAGISVTLVVGIGVISEELIVPSE